MEADAWWCLGRLALRHQRYQDAKNTFRRVRRLSESSAHHRFTARTLCHLGLIAQLRRLPDEADTRYHQALNTARRANDPLNQAGALIGLGTLAEARGEKTAAETLLGQAVATVDSCYPQDLFDIHYFVDLVYLADLTDAHGKPALAETFFRLAEKHVRTTGDHYWYGWPIYVMGECAFFRGDFDAASKHFTEAMNIGKKQHDTVPCVAGLMWLGHIAEKTGQLTRARENYGRALSLATTAMRQYRSQENSERDAVKCDLLYLSFLTRKVAERVAPPRALQ